MLKKLWNYMSGRSNFIPSLEQIVMWLAIVLGIYHLGLLAMYAYYGMTIMTAVNVFSVSLYATCAVAAWRKAKFIRLLQIYYLEIMMQVLVAGAMLGNHCGFEFYLVAITCLAFHMGYLFRADRKFNPMHYVLIAALAFLSYRAWTAVYPPYYAFRDPAAEQAIYMVNYYSAILVIVLSMSTLLIQIIHLEGRLVQKNQELEILSHTDALTGLVNRRSIEENYDRVMAHSKMYAVILGDIDDFKKINDTYGHNTGDTVLQELAKIFKAAVREDDIVCRWGGEEILIFLPLCKKSGAELTANRVMEKIRAMRIESVDKGEFGLTMTLGIADSEEGEDLWNVIQKADDRLYRGKAQGKNCIVQE